MKPCNVWMCHTKPSNLLENWDLNKTIASIWLSILLLISHVVQGTIGRYGEACSNTIDCDAKLGLVCNKNYFGGCAKGICFCANDKTWDETVRKCKYVKLPKSSCNRDTDLCTGKSTCLYSVCRCPHGMSTEQDSRECLPSHTTRIIGQPCSPSTDICYHYTEKVYAPGPVECVSGKCQCKDGYSQDGLTCRLKRIGETGCRENSCVYGAVCVEGICVCSGGRRPARNGEVCISHQANHDLVGGQVCDDHAHNRNPLNVCNDMYTCSQCPGKTSYTCIKFTKKDVPSTEGGSSGRNGYDVTSSTSKKSFSLFTLLLLILTTFVNR